MINGGLRNTARQSSIALGLCLWAFLGAAAQGKWEQTNILMAGDAAEDDWYGVAVATTADIVLIGTENTDSSAPITGAAYLVDVLTGQQQHKLIAADVEMMTLFGNDVAIVGNVAVVGAMADHDVEFAAGAIYVFDATSADQLHKLTATDGGLKDNFGFSVATDGIVVLGGAPNHDAGAEDSGAAYLFDLSSGDLLHKLTPDDPFVDHLFGWDVAVNDDMLLVSAIGDASAGENTGAAYLFDVATGAQLHKLTADDAAEGDLFGYSIALNDAVALIGAPDDGDGTDLGAAYIFDLTTGLQITKFKSKDGSSGHRFGWSVAMHADLAVAGATGDYYSRGAAYLFDLSDPAAPLQVRKFTPRGGLPSDYFGYGVGIGDGVVVVGSPGDDDIAEYAGSAHLFEACGADVYGDEMVDVTDLLEILSLWGTGDVYADVNGDDIVDVLDLLMVLANWGPCD